MFFSNTFSCITSIVQYRLSSFVRSVIYYQPLSAPVPTINLCLFPFAILSFCLSCFLSILPVPFRLSFSLPNLPPHIPAIVKYVFCGKASNTLLPSSGSLRVQPWNRTAYFIDLAGCLLPTPPPATTARRSFRSA